MFILFCTVHEFNESDLPFTFLHCSDKLLPPHKRPFFVAGAIATWIDMDDPIPDIESGYMSATEDFLSQLEVDDSLLTDLVLYGTVKPERC